MSENGYDIDLQIERLDSFLNEGLPEINQILREYHQQHDFYGVEDHLSNRVDMNNSNENTIGENNYALNMFPKVQTPLLTSSPTKSYNTNSAATRESAPTQRMSARPSSSSHTLMPRSTAIGTSTMSSLETLCFLDNVQDMLNNIRDYADYVSDYPLHRDDLLNKVHMLVRYCHDICVGVPNTCAPEMQMLYGGTLSSPISSSSASFTQLQVPLTSCGSLGATPRSRVRRARNPNVGTNVASSSNKSAERS